MFWGPQVSQLNMTDLGSGVGKKGAGASGFQVVQEATEFTLMFVHAPNSVAPRQGLCLFPL